MTRHQLPRLELRDITKQYPGCRANDNVDLCILPGEIHALLGENGAGKSTLMKTIYGVVKPDCGEILWNGKRVAIHEPAMARQLGIGMVFQHFSLFESLSVVENIALATDYKKRNLKPLSDKIAQTSEHYGMKLQPDQKVAELSTGERQRVEIIRCLVQDIKLLILDEPTSVLTPHEVTELFNSLRKLSREGCSILFISHKLDEVKNLCHSASVLRQGRITGHCVPAEESTQTMARLMVGEDTPITNRFFKAEGGESRMRLQGLSYTDETGVRRLDDIQLDLRSGEIVGIAGVAGNGQESLLEALSGEIVSEPKSIEMFGQIAGDWGPQQRRKAGLGVVPEDRLRNGSVPSLDLIDNTLLTAFGHGLVKGGMINFKQVRVWAERIIGEFNVKTPGPKISAGALSGGNLQKFIIGREILQQPRILIAAHPTWGIDIGAQVAIHKALIKLRDQGCAILIISEDIDELFQISDRIGAICSGRISPFKTTADINLDLLGQWMAGNFETSRQESLQC